MADPEGAPARRCARCSAPAALAARGTAHCPPCFVLSFTSRFTKALQTATRTTRTTRPRRLVVACSGGPASTALVHLVHETLFSPDATKHKGSRYSHFSPFTTCEVLYVDHSAVPGYGPDRTEEVRRLVRSIAPDFTFTALRLQDVFLRRRRRRRHSSGTARRSFPLLEVSTRSPDLPIPSTPGAGPEEEEEEEEEEGPEEEGEEESSSSASSWARERLVALLSPRRFSPTALASLQRSLLDSLLTSHVAAAAAAAANRSDDDAVLLLGDTGTRSAIRTLAGMSQGRGYSIGEEVALEHILPSSAAGAVGAVTVLRPLGQTVHKEVAFYNRECARVEPLVMLNPETSVPGEDRVEVSAKTRSIPGLVEDFILKLDAEFPSTVPTVVRTAHKLGLRSSEAAFVDAAPSPSSAAGCRCAVCGLPAQPHADEWRKAITISDLQAALAAAAESHPADVTRTGTGTGAPERRTGAGGGGGSAAAVTTTMAKRREPYQPSPAHLLVDGEDGARAPAEEEEEEEEEEAGTEAGTDSLARYLCYGCLLVLSEPTTTARGTGSGGGGKTQRRSEGRREGEQKQSDEEDEDEVIGLPGYVAEAVVMEERRRRRRRRGVRADDEEAGDGVVGTKEVRGDEAMRREVERYLL